MSRALIGYSGFVGGTLRRQASFDACFRSTDIETIGGRSFELVVCAGAPAEKWKANADPAADWANLERLMRALETVRADRAVLVSTVDVYATPRGVDEDTPTFPQDAQPYGRHRLLLEQFFAARFDTVVARLPGLYGQGLKKNIIYDLMHGNMLDRINPRAVFQFYGLPRLWSDIQRALEARLPIVNFATEPVSVGDVARAAFGVELPDRTDLAAVTYDVRTRHATAFGAHGCYLEDRSVVLAGISEFVRQEHGRQALALAEAAGAARAQGS